jgi:hypothetical protein
MLGFGGVFLGAIFWCSRLPLLRRPHDHCRGLCPRRRTARPALRRWHPDLIPVTFLLCSCQHPLDGTSRSRRRTSFIPALARAGRAPQTSSQSARRIRRQPPVRNHQRLSALSNPNKTVCRHRRCRDKSP